MTELAQSALDLQRRCEELLEQNALLTEAVAARDAFIAVAAHELRNPMTPIVARVDLLRRMVGTASNAKIAQSLEQIDRLISMFVKRATTLLDVSRMTSSKLKVACVEVDACEVATAVVDNFRPLAEHARCTLDLDLAETRLAIAGDRLALEQILDNLVSNAIKYGGGMPIAVGVMADHAAGRAKIVVRDAGPGISPENQARIFERFERAVKPGERAGGFGVGLWIVKQLTEAMDGTIAITSVPGAGSSFCVSLPLIAVERTT